MTLIAIPLAALTALATFAGGMLALRLSHALETVIALTGGIVVAVALFDVLPEAIDGLDDARLVGTLVAAGFLAFFLADRALHLHGRGDHDQERAAARKGVIGALGLSLHSFVDGLGIGLAFGLDTATGVLVFVAVISHDFADGLNTVSFVLRGSQDRGRALRWLVADSIAPVLGAVTGSALAVSHRTLGYLLALYAGFFIYMGATDLLPEAHRHGSWRRVALTLAGFAAIFLISSVAAT